MNAPETHSPGNATVRGTDSYAGTCSVCGHWGTYRKDGASIRETFLCRTCSSSLRYRGQANALLQAYGSSGTRCLADLVQHEPFRRLSIYEPGLIGPFRRYLNALRDYRQSHFWTDVPPGAPRDGVECQDLMRLTYPDEAFDLVITSDIFEHIRRPYVAFREIRRVLRPGGHHVFSIPVTAPMPAETVFRVDTTTDDDRHILPPHYHSAPRGGRSLVYAEFGADMLDELAGMGLPTEVVALDTPHQDLRALLTFVSRRRTEGHCGGGEKP